MASVENTRLRAVPPVAAREPVRPRALGTARAVWHRLVRANSRIEESWIGDVIGAICLFLIMFAAPWFLLLISEVMK